MLLIINFTALWRMNIAYRTFSFWTLIFSYSLVKGHFFLGEYLCMFKKKVYSLFVEYNILYINCIIQNFCNLNFCVFDTSIFQRNDLNSLIAIVIYVNHACYCTFISLCFYILILCAERFITVRCSGWSVLSPYQDNVSLLVSNLYLPWIYMLSALNSVTPVFLLLSFVGCYLFLALYFQSTRVILFLVCLLYLIPSWIIFTLIYIYCDYWYA